MVALQRWVGLSEPGSMALQYFLGCGVGVIDPVKCAGKLRYREGQLLAPDWSKIRARTELGIDSLLLISCAWPGSIPRKRPVPSLPCVMPDVRIPEREERRLPRQCNSQKKGSLLLTLARASATTNAVVQGQKKPPSPSSYINL